MKPGIKKPGVKKLAPGGREPSFFIPGFGILRVRGHEITPRFGNLEIRGHDFFFSPRNLEIRGQAYCGVLSIRTLRPRVLPRTQTRAPPVCVCVCTLLDTAGTHQTRNTCCWND